MPTSLLLLLAPAFAQALLAKEREEAKEQKEQRNTRPVVSTSTHQYISHKAKVDRLAEMVKEKAEAPKLGMDLTAQKWDRWRSRWARYKCYNRIQEHHDCKFLPT